MKKTVFLNMVGLFMLVHMQAQELNCNFSINTSRIQGTNKQVFTTLEASVRDFLNNTVWTGNVFEAVERIECNIMLDITDDPVANDFKGKLQIQSRRPVYGSSYNTVLFNYVDEDVEFRYEEFDPIQYSENTFISNLSSLLSFYAYIIIGLDYDSFSPQGGAPYFEKAERIMTVAQTSSYMGWRPGDGKGAQRHKNRYWLIDNLLDKDYKPLRDFSYKYHRVGLDAMEKSPDLGRTSIYDALVDLKKFYDNKPDPYMSLMQVLTDAKSEEIVNIFSEAPQDQKQKVLAIMMAIEPAGGSKYDKLK
ncbi:MAG: DUF4835 family protein [Bacteroidales bacterium]|nr:DUF4835 family protein [Bacteroidales bacterium]